MATLDTRGATVVTAQVLEGLGAPRDSAQKVGEWLVNADLTGHPSHGMIRLTDYRNRCETGDLVPTGRPSVRQDSGSVVLVDGGQGFGHLAAEELTRLMAERIPAQPAVIGGIVNASHTGRLGEWAEQAIRSGVILWMCTASLAKGNVAAYGAREPRLGTNPLSVGVPAADGDAFMLDYATSKIAGGKIQHLIDVNEPTPPDSLIDKEGRPSTDPRDWLDGGMLLPFGAHKGYGLALLVSILSGCLVGQVAEDRSRGVFALALDPGVFTDREVVLRSVRDQLARMRDTLPAPGFERVEVPGDFEKRNREKNSERFQLPDSTWNDTVSLGASLGLDPGEMAQTAGLRGDSDASDE